MEITYRKTKKKSESLVQYSPEYSLRFSLSRKSKKEVGLYALQDPPRANLYAETAAIYM